MDGAFSAERVRQMRTHPDGVYVDLVHSGTAPQPGRIRRLYREFLVHNEDGDPIGRRREIVHDVGRDGELRSALLTVIARDQRLCLDDCTLEMARAAGYRTAQSLRDAWHSRHPKSDYLDTLWFILGDRRDLPLFMGWTGKVGGDYVRSRGRAMDQAEALTREQLEALAVVSRQGDEARRARASRTTESLATRIARLEAAYRDAATRGDNETRKALRQELRIVDQRLVRMEDKARRLG